MKTNNFMQILGKIALLLLFFGGIALWHRPNLEVARGTAPLFRPI